MTRAAIILVVCTGAASADWRDEHPGRKTRPVDTRRAMRGTATKLDGDQLAMYRIARSRERRSRHQAQFARGQAEAAAARYSMTPEGHARRWSWIYNGGDLWRARSANWIILTGRPWWSPASNSIRENQLRE